MTTVNGERESAPSGVQGRRADTPAAKSTTQRLRASVPELAVPSLLVVTFLIFGTLIPDLFLTWTNTRITLAAQATPLLLAVAVTLTLRVGDIDLSVAGVMVLSGAVIGVLTQHGTPPLLACFLGIATGLLVGLVNCLFIIVIGLDSLIVTLGVFTGVVGLTTYISHSNLVTAIPLRLQDFANYGVLGLPLTVWIGWMTAASLWGVFEFTPLGRYLLFVGGNRAAGTLAGLRVNRLRAFAFVSGSLIASMAGALLAGSLGSVDPSSSGSYLLGPITAAFLGTTCIQLGRFNIMGTLIGLYLIAFGITGLQLMGYQGWVTDVFNGVALVLALTFAKYFEAMRTGSISFRRGASTAAKRGAGAAEKR